jgi:hypothetical protein
VEPTSQDRIVARGHLDGARGALRQLAAAASSGGNSLSTEVVRGAVQIAISSLDEVGRSLALDEPDVQRVACPFCGNLVMPAASLCGFCWRKLTPKSGT